MSETKTPFPLLAQLEDGRLLDCIHCGICLSACPTYEILGTEADSPRGRIYFIRAMVEGRAELTEESVSHLDSCLGCLACQTACPSAVHYGEMLNRARAEIEVQFPRPSKDKRARKVLLDLVTSPGKLAPLMLGAKMMGGIFGEGGGPVGMVNRFLFGPKAPSMPAPPDAGLTVKPLPELTPAKGQKRARVALLGGCVMQVLFQRVNHATIRVLAENGCEVLVPRSFGCCGAFHLHNGFLDDAKTRARGLIEAAERQEFDALVTNSAGCGSAMKEYVDLFEGEESWQQRARQLTSQVKDVSEYLAEIGLRPPTREFPRRVAYHDACHLAHAQKIRAEPRKLLSAIPGLKLVEFANSDWCCGSAGIYNFLQPELASQLQEKKVAHILDSGPEVLVTGNPGCHSWIEAGLKARGSGIIVRHTMEVLDEAYGG
jgi:glycolate oxidase iron-sulfur subunit